jgi:hypothetical protein
MARRKAASRSPKFEPRLKATRGGLRFVVLVVGLGFDREREVFLVDLEILGFFLVLGDDGFLIEILVLTPDDLLAALALCRGLDHRT